MLTDRSTVLNFCDHVAQATSTLADLNLSLLNCTSREDITEVLLYAMKSLSDAYEMAISSPHDLLKVPTQLLLHPWRSNAARCRKSAVRRLTNSTLQDASTPLPSTHYRRPGTLLPASGPRSKNSKPSTSPPVLRQPAMLWWSPCNMNVIRIYTRLAPSGIRFASSINSPNTLSVNWPAAIFRSTYRRS